MSWISNYLSNTIVTGTTWADTITNYGIGNITIIGGKGNDSIDNHNYNGNLFWYNYGDGYDIINGFTENDILQINDWSHSTMVSGNDFIVSVGSGSIVLKNAAQNTVHVIDQWGILNTYSTSKVFYGTDTADLMNIAVANTTVFGYAGDDTIYNSSNGAQIYGGDGHDDVLSYGYNVGISGGNGADSILSYGDNGVIIGNNGNDTIYVQGKGNILDTGQGNDVIIFETGSKINLIAYKNGDGFDTVNGFSENDTLQIDGGTYSTKKSGDDVVVTVGDGKISLIGAASLDTINIKGTKLLTVTNSTKSPVTVDSAVKVINASKRTTAVKITGNALANKISGGSKNDSLYGASGNDSINGGAGNDIFIYKPGEGTDTITDYASGDILKILKADGSKVGYTKAAFASNKLTLTINGGGSVIFKNVSAGDKININGTIRTISGNTLK